MPDKAFIFLAFANAPAHTRDYLEELNRECAHLEDILTPCPYVVAKTRNEVSIGRIEETFGKLGEAIRIFHFSGHAGPAGIQVEDQGKQPSYAYARGLASFIGKQKGVRLAFLNGCSSEEQVRYFHKAHVPVVIATTHPVRDDVAREFAEHFYKSLVSGRSIREAFGEAEAKLLIPYSSATELYPHRAMHWPGKIPTYPDHPYQLHIDPRQAKAADERLTDWASLTPQKGAIDRNLYLMCNRVTATKQFNRSVRQWREQELRYPSAFIIHGEEQEEPPSLATRFLHFTVRELLARELNKDWVSVKHQPPIELPSREDFDHPDPELPLYQRDQYLKEAFRLGSDELRPEAILQRIGKQADAAFIQHNLLATEWHKGHQQFLAEYLGTFWQVPLEPGQPDLVILINVIYPASNAFSRLLNLSVRNIEAALKHVGKLPNCTLLKKLPSVEKDDLLKWRLTYMADQVDLETEVFRRKKRLPMRAVQQRLLNVIDRYNELYAS